jgi:hypothetical protein
MSRTPREQDVFKQSNNEPDHRIENGDKPIQGADANQNPALGSHSENSPQGLEQHGTDAGEPNQNHVFGKDGLRWGWTNVSDGDLNHGPQQHVFENVIQDQSGHQSYRVRSARLLLGEQLRLDYRWVEFLALDEPSRPFRLGSRP